MTKITLTLEGSFAAIRAPFMGERWGEYRLAIEGAVFNKAKKCNYATLDKVPGIIVRLREAEFAIECSAELTRALAEHTTQLWNDVQGAKERAKAFDDEMRQSINPKTGKPYYLYPFQYSGITWLTMKHGALLADDMGLGKSQPTDELVLTPSGWRRIGELKIGDGVVGFRGGVTRVTGVFPQGMLPVFRLNVGRDRYVTASDDHLWMVNDHHTTSVKTTRELRDTIERGWLLPLHNKEVVPDAEGAYEFWEAECASLNSIESVGVAECVCISVAAEDHLYVTRDYIVTHNTIQTIAAFPPSARVLVVGPAVAKGVWRTELARWRPHLRASLLDGRGSFKWPEPGEVVVTNYDILPDVHVKECLEARKDKKTKLVDQHDQDCIKAQNNLFVPALQALAKQCKGCLKRSWVAKQCPGCAPFLKTVPTDMVLVSDEAHNLKNANAQRTVRFRGLSTAVRSKGGRVWLLTATPLMNHPIELWSVFQSALIAQEVFGDFKTFLRLFDAKAASEFGGYTFGTPDTEEIAERMQRVMLRRMKRDVLQDLPAKDWRTVTVDVDDKTLKACDKYVQSHGGMEALVEKLGKVLSFETMSVVGKALAIAKIPAMLSFVEDFEQQEEPLVVFSAHRAPIDELAKREGWGVITGDTSPDERSRLETSFQAGELKGIGCTIRAGGVSITLTRACNVLRVDREWTPALNSQAEDRIYRLGQDRPVLVTDLVANHPLDLRVTELTTEKQIMIDASVDAQRQMEREAS
jgi:SNF2 family DNA or RNA helicase